jgi:hypothetical protein
MQTLRDANHFFFLKNPQKGRKRGLVEMGCKVLSCLTFRTFWLILHKIILVFENY